MARFKSLFQPNRNPSNFGNMILGKPINRNLKLQQALSKRKLQRAKVGFQEQTLQELKINNKIFFRYIRNKRPTRIGESNR